MTLAPANRCLEIAGTRESFASLSRAIDCCPVGNRLRGTLRPKRPANMAARSRAYGEGAKPLIDGRRGGRCALGRRLQCGSRDWN
jgi:hypothetical protein